MSSSLEKVRLRDVILPLGVIGLFALIVALYENEEFEAICTDKLHLEAKEFIDQSVPENHSRRVIYRPEQWRIIAKSDKYDMVNAPIREELFDKVNINDKVKVTRRRSHWGLYFTEARPLK